MLSTQRGLLWAAALGVATIAGACTSVLDFTECYADEDCRSFFTDNKPMRCDTDGRCAVKDEGCDQNSECEALGDSYICGLSHRCYDYSEGGDLCDEPVFPNADERDNVVFVGSLINRAGDGAAIERRLEAADRAFRQAFAMPQPALLAERAAALRKRPWRESPAMQSERMAGSGTVRGEHGALVGTDGAAIAARSLAATSSATSCRPGSPVTCTSIVWPGAMPFTCRRNAVPSGVERNIPP